MSQGVGEKGEVPTAAAIPLKPAVVLRYALVEREITDPQIIP
jgi:hypothetical protein